MQILGENNRPPGAPILEVKDLSVSFLESAQTEALAGVNLELAAGEVVGLLGESGCGKSTLALSILQTLPPAARITGGSIFFEGRNLLALPAKEMQKIRGAKISIIFQEPGLALNPVLRVGTQIMEVLRAHNTAGRNWQKQRARSLLEQVEIPDGDRIFGSYPHELSGGEAQRVLIAQALSCQPSIVIADEPTASLDTVIQAEVLNLLARLRKECGLTLLFITHNPALLVNFADRVLVMNAGKIVEQGTTESLFQNPTHSFTKAVVAAMAKRVAVGVA